MSDGTFDAFVRENAGSLYASAWLLSGDREDARDLVQSALLVLFRRWDRITHDNLRAYVITVMVREHRRTVRRSVRRILAERRAAKSTRLDIEYSGDGDGLATYLAGLGPRQRAAVVLRVVEDRSEADVARLLGCSVGTVKSQTSRAISVMRERAAADNAMSER